MKSVPKLSVRLTKAQHERCLGDQQRLGTFGNLKNTERLLEVGTTIADLRCKSLDCLYIVRVDVQTGAGNEGDHVEIPSIIPS
jgi:hypothetical protein